MSVIASSVDRTQSHHVKGHKDVTLAYSALCPSRQSPKDAERQRMVNDSLRLKPTMTGGPQPMMTSLPPTRPSMARSLRTRLGCQLCPQERPSLFGQDGSMPVAAEQPNAGTSAARRRCTSIDDSIARRAGILLQKLNGWGLCLLDHSRRACVNCVAGGSTPEI